MQLLQLENISKSYRRGNTNVPAVKNINLTIDKGEFIAIVGPSGSGKTTLLNIAGCLDRPDAGSLLYGTTELTGLKDKELAEYRKVNIGFIFQSFNLIPVLSVGENVELPLLIERKHTKDSIRGISREILDSVGIGALIDSLPNELSGGQEQRVAIARALVKEPLIVLADEPTANLDSGTADEVMGIMKKMNREKGITFVFSTHDELVMRHAEKTVTLKDGEVADR